MERYRKLLVALIGFGAIVGSEFGLGALAGATDELTALLDAAIAALTALGVYAVPNDPEVLPDLDA